MPEMNFSWDLFYKVPVVGIVRGLSLAAVQSILPVYKAAGLTNIEITMNTPDAGSIIRYAADKMGGQLNIGAGTVCDLSELDLALECGAQFIVTPVFVEEVIERCVNLQIPVFPGAFTPTEIFRAWRLGASLVKVYPASALGPEFIRDVKAPLNQIKLMPTGGVNLENLPRFIKAGADAVGLGNALFDARLIAAGNWMALEEHFKEYGKLFSKHVHSNKPDNKPISYD